MTFGWQIVAAVDADNPVLGDMRVSKRKFVRHSTLGERVAQAIQVRLRWWSGEWFLDRGRGVPYLEQLLRKGVSEQTVRAVLRQHIEAVAGVARISSLAVTIDRTARFATVDLEVVTTEGEAVPIAGVNLTVGG